MLTQLLYLPSEIRSLDEGSSKLNKGICGVVRRNLLESVECKRLGNTIKGARCLTQGKQRPLVVFVIPCVKFVGISGAMDAELGANLEENLAREIAQAPWVPSCGHFDKMLISSGEDDCCEIEVRRDCCLIHRA